MSNGNFNISGNGVDGEGTFTITNGTAEIGLHMVVGQMAETQEVVIAADKATAVNSLKSTSENDHTETEITFTKDGRCNRPANAGQGVLILRSTPPPRFPGYPVKGCLPRMLSRPDDYTGLKNVVI